MLYTVGEMAKELGIPASTLRYYDHCWNTNAGTMRLPKRPEAKTLSAISRTIPSRQNTGTLNAGYTSLTTGPEHRGRTNSTL